LSISTLEAEVERLEAELIQAKHNLLDAVMELRNKLMKQSKLTPRELEIMQLARKGFMNQNIAANLGITERTVKHHLTQVFRKTGVAKRGEL
jgi:DNA-binding NarL/FixJ family response regulator